MAREQITSQFPTMGEQGIPHSVLNLSGDRTPYTIMQPRDAGGATHSEVPGAGTKANRGASMIQNAQGPVNKPLAMRWPANAACATEGGRNVILMPSASGSRDFWARRAEGPRI